MNKIILGMAAASAMFFSAAATAMPIISVGFDADNNGTFDDIVADGDPQGGIFPDLTGDLDLTVNAVTAWLNDSTRVTAGTLSGNPFNIHMTASMTTPGTVTFGTTVQNLTLADVADVIFSVGANGFDLGTTTSAYFDASNAQFGTGTLIATAVGAAPLSFSSSQFSISDPDLFSLTIISKIVNNTGGASVDADIDVPEPSILALFGMGLLGLGLARRRIKG